METATQIQSNVSVRNDQNIGLVERTLYGCGDVGYNLIFATAASFLTFFLTDVAGVGAAAVGTILLLSRLFDGFSDFIMGFLIDKTKSKHGKARPWILWIAIPSGISMALLFSAPDFGPTGKVIYAFLTYNFAFTICMTAYSMPYGTLTALMTQNQFQRSILNIVRMVGGVVTALFVNIVTIPLVQAFGEGVKGWQGVGFLYGALTAILFIIAFAVTKERVKSVSDEKVPAKKALGALKQNTYWKMILAVGVLVYMLFTLPGVNIYYAKYILQNEALMGPIMMATFIPVIAGMLLMGPVIKRIGKRNLVLPGLIIYVLGSIILMLNPTNPSWVVAGVLVKHIGFAPIVGTLFAFMADTIEYGEWKTGIRSEGLVFAAGSIGQKVGMALAGALIGWFLSLGGYVPNAATQSASTVFAIKSLFIYIPVLIYIIITVIMYFWKLDQEYPQIVEELNQRRAAR